MHCVLSRYIFFLFCNIGCGLMDRSCQGRNYTWFSFCILKYWKVFSTQWTVMTIIIKIKTAVNWLNKNYSQRLAILLQLGKWSMTSHFSFKPRIHQWPQTNKDDSNKLSRKCKTESSPYQANVLNKYIANHLAHLHEL